MAQRSSRQLPRCHNGAQLPPGGLQPPAKARVTSQHRHPTFLDPRSPSAMKDRAQVPLRGLQVPTLARVTFQHHHRTLLNSCSSAVVNDRPRSSRRPPQYKDCADLPPRGLQCLTLARVTFQHPQPILLDSSSPSAPSDHAPDLPSNIECRPVDSMSLAHSNATCLSARSPSSVRAI
ncbi:hypothetical protein SCP_0608000 [Sparassis crispa]|uniref:Uncharacterized protein n=1 Tax=Sparassis crispa TaxID=139825 RepID=A0A401GRN9_9APHY|nr:hypothetical protein SCP_0608000 [Sparassis crispa]GBE84820.1 hypothetical protein SCP_0608000 [Sparassis crispa]